MNEKFFIIMKYYWRQGTVWLRNEYEYRKIIQNFLLIV
jgi:hypothetical protein